MNKRYILRENFKIDQLVKKQQSVGSKYYALYYDKRDDFDDIKIAISASKKLGRAFERNYQKRVVKSIISKMIIEIKGYNLLLIIKKASCELDFKKKQEQLIYLFNKFLSKEKMKVNEKK